MMYKCFGGNRMNASQRPAPNVLYSLLVCLETRGGKTTGNNFREGQRWPCSLPEIKSDRWRKKLYNNVSSGRGFSVLIVKRKKDSLVLISKACETSIKIGGILSFVFSLNKLIFSFV